MDKTLHLEQDKIPRLLARYSIPAIAGMGIQALYNITDRIFVGHGIGIDGISALTANFPLMLIFIAFGMLFGVGGSAAFSIALGEKDKILPILFKSFVYDSPRAEICCEIGYHYKEMENYSASFKWFDIAAHLQKPDSIGFVLIDYWGYIPNIEACVCLTALGDYVKAYDYNERARKV